MKDGHVGMKGGDVGNLGILHMEAGHESLVPVWCLLLLGSNARHNDAGA